LRRITIMKSKKRPGWLSELRISIRDGVLAGLLVFGLWTFAMREVQLETAALRAEGVSGEAVSQRLWRTSLVTGGMLAAGLAVAVVFLRIGGFVRRRMRPGDVRLFERLTEGIPTMIFQCRQFPTGHVSVTYTNSAIRTIFEVEPKSARRQAGKLLERLHPDDHERVWQALIEALKKEMVWRQEFRVVLPRAGVVWRFGQANAERLPDGGTLWHGFVTDVTWRKTAEAALRAGEERLRLAARAGSIGMWDMDLATGELIWNDQMISLHGAERGNFSGTREDFLRYVHPEDRDRVGVELERAIAKGKAFSSDYRIVRPDQEIRYVKSDGQVLVGASGGAARVVGTNIDMTAQRQIAEDLRAAKERAEAADRAKSDFLAMMSHEIRTPMNGVLGFASMLRETALSNDQRNYIETIESCAENLLVVINEMLDLSKIDAGHIDLVAAPFDLRACVDEVFRLLQPKAAEKGLEYALVMDEALPEVIEADRVRLMQILMNLLGNAIKFTSQGSVRLAVAAKPVRANEERLLDLVLKVEDTGVGIAAGHAEEVFKPFFQVDNTAKRRFGGTGLGLAITQRLCRLMGGRLDMWSELGKGSTFVATVRVRAGLRADRVETDAPSDHDVHDGTDAMGLRVLVVEDNPVNRRLAGLLLVKIGCSCEFAETGEEAINACQRHPFDAVLMDIQLPEMDGLEATQAIRQIETQRRLTARGDRLPIIAMTANAMSGDRDRCLNAGMSDYITKPVRRNDLIRALLGVRELPVAPTS
jgi:signal transduction histidine kinase/ActR/RegA family two-component response regulator